MPTIKTNLSTEESARLHRFEPIGGIVATSVQEAIEELDTDKLAVASNFAIEFIIDGGGQVLNTGEKGHLEVPVACTLTRVTLAADQVGSCVVDIWKSTYAGFPPLGVGSIIGTAQPALSSAQTYQDSTLTNWVRNFSAGDLLAFELTSVSLLQRITVSLLVTRV